MDYLDVLYEAVKRGGDQALANQRTARTVSDAGGGGLTTDQDQSAQDTIFGLLRLNFPDCKLIGEEGDAQQSAEDAFIVDPIDGTVNYARDGSDWCCTIAHKSGKDIDVGVIYQPRTALMAQGWRSRQLSLTRNNHLLDIPAPVPPFKLAQTVIQMPIGGEFSDEVIQNVQVPLIKNTRFVRNVFSNTGAILELLQGICDAHIGYGSVWDFAAGKLLVELAGGVTGTVWGDPIDVNLIAPQRVVFARSQEIFDAIIPFTSRWPHEHDMRGK